MTPLCTIVLAVITCTVAPGTPRPDPAAAAAVLAASGTAFELPHQFERPDPQVLVFGDAGASGPWIWPATPAPARRLDGTRLDGPRAVYGPTVVHAGGWGGRHVGGPRRRR